MEQQNHYRFFSHEKCEYFPCHPGADSTRFNCLFCYCPLYTLGDKCGGQFSYTSEGIKDCTNCLLPHQPEGYDRILESWPMLLELLNERRNSPSSP